MLAVLNKPVSSFHWEAFVVFCASFGNFMSDCFFKIQVKYHIPLWKNEKSLFLFCTEERRKKRRRRNIKHIAFTSEMLVFRMVTTILFRTSSLDGFLGFGGGGGEGGVSPFSGSAIK